MVPEHEVDTTESDMDLSSSDYEKKTMVRYYN